MTELSIFTRFTTQGASSRYRYYLYLPYLMRAGYNVQIDSFFDVEYLQRFYSGVSRSKFKLANAYLKRLFAVLSSGRNMIVEYELFPYLPVSIELLLLKNKAYIMNVDDNVWDNYHKNRLLRSKYNRLMRNASGVIVANDFLVEKVSSLNSSIIKIPTVINLEDYQIDAPKETIFTLVWIGTPVTYRKYLLPFGPIFQMLAKKMDFKLRVVAAKKLENESVSGVSMEFHDWSPVTEVSLMMSSHVGIMPLVDDGFSVGKSAFKLIQYCGAGIPSICSDIGENKKVIRHEKEGYVVGSAEAFGEGILRLYGDKGLLDTMSRNAKMRAEDFSVQTHFPRLEKFLSRIFA